MHNFFEDLTFLINDYVPVQLINIYIDSIYLYKDVTYKISVLFKVFIEVSYSNRPAI